MNYLPKITKYGLYATLLLPLFFTSFTFFPWLFGKTIIFQIMVEILLFLHLLSLRQTGKPTKRFDYLDWSILVFLVILTITSFTGVNTANSFWGNQARANGVFTWWHFGAWYWLLKNNFTEKKDWQRALIAGLAVAVAAWLTVIFENALPGSWQSESGGGIIGNRGFAAAYFLSAIGVGAYLAATIKNNWRYLFLAGALVLSASLFFTNTRAAMVGIFFGLIGSLVLAAFKLPDKKHRLVIIGVTVGLFLALSGALVASRTAFFSRIFPRLSGFIAPERLFTGSAETRLIAWGIAAKGFAERPWLGWGWGNYDVVFNKYFDPQFLKFGFTETVWDKPHNWFLEIGDSAGILGLASYLGIFIVAGYFLIKKQSDLTDNIGKIILFGALIAYFIQNLFLFETTNTLLMFFLMLAFISNQKVETNHRTDRDSSSLRSLGMTVILISYFLILIFSLFEYNYLSLKNSYYLSRAHAAPDALSWSGYADKTLAVPATFGPESAIFLAERFVQLDKAGLPITEPTVVSSTVKVAAYLEESARRYLDNPIFSIWAGQAYLALGEKVNQNYYIDAERNLLSATALSPRKQDFLFLLARLYLEKKEYVNAISYQKQAIAAAPEMATSHWFLGLTYVMSGEVKLGLVEIEEAIKLGLGPTLEQKLYIIDLYAGEQNYGKVIEQYSALLVAEPENVNWYIKLATAYAVAGRKEEALATVRQIVSMYPSLKPDADKFIKQYKLE